MPALEQNGGSLLADELACEPGVLLVPYLDPGEHLRLVSVGRDQIADGYQVPFESIHHPVVEKVVADRRDHHRVYDQRYVTVLKDPGHRRDDLGIVQHAGLYGSDLGILQHGLDLVHHHIGGQRVYPLHRSRVLGSDSGYSSACVHPQGGHGLYVGLYPRSSDGIRTRNGKGASHAALNRQRNIKQVGKLPFGNSYIIIWRGGIR